MLEKIISIKNVGRFRNSTATPIPVFSKRTLIYAPNAYGKSTLCSILRSYSLGNPDEIVGRKTLGAEEATTISLLFDKKTHLFANEKWKDTNSQISVFDAHFVQANVYSGEGVDVGNRRSLYRVIVGEGGVHLANREARLIEDVKQAQAHIKSLEGQISSLGSGLSPQQFCALSETQDVDSRIAEQETVVNQLRSSKEIETNPALLELPKLEVSRDGLSVLSKTLSGISSTAESRVREHFRLHSMDTEGDSWIESGLAFVKEDACPFCGRDGLQSLELFRMYTEYFSEAFKSLSMEVKSLYADFFADAVGSKGRQEISAAYEKNAVRSAAWARHIPDVEMYPSVSDLIALVRSIDSLLIAAIEVKQSTLDKDASSSEFAVELAQLLETANFEIDKLNAVAISNNALIQATKDRVGTTDLDSAQKALAKLELSKVRWSATVNELCQKYQKALSAKAGIEAQKVQVRKSLDEHSAKVIKPYELKINTLLERFNAGFRIVETDHSYVGGVAASSYAIQIAGHKVPLGDSRTPINQPSFKNTLSSGDKATLALAFFLAQLDCDPKASDRVVVFDDPFNSQDAFRRLQTVFEILERCSTCRQVIVLSHDVNFLRQIWDKCSPHERAAAQIDYHESEGSKIRQFDLEKASYSRTSQELDDLIAFRQHGKGAHRDIIKKLRVVCETFFRRTYSHYFTEDDNLGTILRIIRDDPNHPARAQYLDIDRINEYSAIYHHGEDSKGRYEPPIDQEELVGMVSIALKTVNAVAA